MRTQEIGSEYNPRVPFVLHVQLQGVLIGIWNHVCGLSQTFGSIQHIGMVVPKTPSCERIFLRKDCTTVYKGLQFPSTRSKILSKMMRLIPNDPNASVRSNTGLIPQ
jgi:hypothetical protein